MFDLPKLQRRQGDRRPLIQDYLTCYRLSKLNAWYTDLRFPVNKFPDFESRGAFSPYFRRFEFQPDSMGEAKIARVQFFLNRATPPCHPALAEPFPSCGELHPAELLDPLAHMIAKSVRDHIDVPTAPICPTDRQ